MKSARGSSLIPWLLAGSEQEPPSSLSKEEAPVLAAHGMSRVFGRRRAVRSLTLELRRGERLAVMGPNGAGKSTLIRLLSTLLRPTRGRLEVSGFDAARDVQAVRSRIGVVLHETLLYPDLSLDENLRFYARLYRLSSVERRIATLSERLDLTGLGGTRVRRLSRGQQQRAAIARALMHDPPVLLLDEPDTGLDAAAFDLLTLELTRNCDRTVVLTTHHPAHAAALATRLLLMKDGSSTEADSEMLGSANGLQAAIARLIS